MMPFARLAARQGKVFVPDFPGYGRSGRRNPAPKRREMVEALAGILDALGLERADLLGNSYGAQILADFAVEHPQRVRRLVWVGPTVNPRRRSFPKQFVDLLSCVPHEKLSLVARVTAIYLKAGPRVVVQTVREALDQEIERILPRVQAPVLVVRGEHDAMARQRWCEQVRDLLPHAQLEVIAGGGHALNYSQPRRLAEAVANFIAGDPRPATGVS
jgi:2-hydroxy-6-oxonona-2,4-dienedioate hydrolase